MISSDNLSKGNLSFFFSFFFIPGNGLRILELHYNINIAYYYKMFQLLVTSDTINFKHTVFPTEARDYLSKDKRVQRMECSLLLILASFSTLLLKMIEGKEYETKCYENEDFITVSKGKL